MEGKCACCTCGFEWGLGKDGIHSCVSELTSKIQKTIELAVEYGGIDGAHHKDWVIDQIVRSLAGKNYDNVIKDACNGEDGPDTYDWDCGIAP